MNTTAQFNRQAIAASVAAFVTTGAMDLTGYTMFGALPLILFLAGFAFYGRIRPTDLGFRNTDPVSYLLSVGIPLVAIAVFSIVAYATGAVDVADTDWTKTWMNIGLMFTTGIIMVAITEEGFFRGLLWAQLSRAGHGDSATLWITTVVFVVWHVPAILLPTDFAPPLAQAPIYFVNATLLGLTWGLIRLISGSLWPAAICHSLWNALVYQLFGFGEKTGDLGIEASWIYNPELGLAGILVNLAVVIFLYRKYRARH